MFFDFWSEAVTRSLYTKRPNPYYIMAPRWYRASAGIRVVHMLCDALVRSGQEAYIHTTSANPELMTPPLTHDVFKFHEDHGSEPIVVYPEVVSGNPLGGNVVVRYLLNRPGFIDGDGQFDGDDLVFAFARDLLPHGAPQDRVLFLPPFDMRVFCPPEDPAKRIPGKVCYYQGRGGQTTIDPALLREDSVQITRDYPQSWEALADLFQQCEYFYCTESSALAGEAALCGCISVVVPNRWAPRAIGENETQGLGVAWGNTPEQIQWARDTVPRFRERMIQQEQEFWLALDHFIDVTQTAARDFQSRPKGHAIRQWMQARALSEVQHGLILRHTAQQPLPTLALIVMDDVGDPIRLTRTLKSIRELIGPLVSTRILIVAPDISGVEPDEGLYAVEVDPARQPGQVNQWLLESAADWFMILNAGEELAPNGVLMTLLEIAAAPQCAAVYGDEIVREPDGGLNLKFRTDFNLDLLLSCPQGLVGHWFYRRSTWQRMGGFAADFAQAFELEFILRLVEEQGLESIGHVNEPLLTTDALPLRDNPWEPDTIRRHLLARGYPLAQVFTLRPGCYEVDYGHMSQAQVSVLILVDSDLAAAQRCLDSVMSNTSYTGYDILLLDRGNTDPQIQAWLQGVEKLQSPTLNVLRFPASCSPDTVRNQAALMTDSPVLLFMADAVMATGGPWLENMLNHALRPEVGCVAPKLIGVDRKIASAGLLLGYGGLVGSPFLGMPLDAAGYMNRLDVDQNYAALSGQCLMLRREVFLAAGGFDEHIAPWSDVDLCLKVHQSGRLNVWTPRAQLITCAPQTAQATAEQENRFYGRWLKLLANDPSYNLNLSLRESAAFELADATLTWRPLAAFRPLPVVLAHPAEGVGRADHRVVQPLRAMHEQGLIEGLLSPHMLSVVDLQRYDPDVIVFQEQTRDAQLRSMLRIKQFSRAFKVYDLQAYLPGAPAKTQEHAHAAEDVWTELRHAGSFVDRLIVSSDAMAQTFAGLNADIRVLKDRLDPALWCNLNSARNHGAKPRLGWVGSFTELSDLAVIEDLIRDLAHQVEWVFLGACPDNLRPFVHEFHSEVDPHVFPAKLASLNLDLALLPRADTLYNRCRGHQRLLEFGICGVPVICSDLECHRGDLFVKRVRNSTHDWLEAIRAHLHEADGRAQLGDHLGMQIRQHWMLEGQGLDEWKNAWLPE